MERVKQLEYNIYMEGLLMQKLAVGKILQGLRKAKGITQEQ